MIGAAGTGIKPQPGFLSWGRSVVAEDADFNLWVMASDKEKSTAETYLRLLNFVNGLAIAIEVECWDPYLGPKESELEKLEKYTDLLDKFTASISRLPQKDIEDGIKLLKVEDVMDS
mgnify:CR=1 FL=1